MGMTMDALLSQQIHDMVYSVGGERIGGEMGWRMDEISDRWWRLVQR